MTNAVLPHFRERKSGAIVIVGSSRGISGAIGGAPYCATKFALEGTLDVHSSSYLLRLRIIMD